MKPDKSAAPLLVEAARAEREGDFARARALCHVLLGDSGGQGSGVGQKHTRQGAQERLHRLGLDPLAWQVGLGALLVYMVAWIYALQANR
jgi:hypothetical protein